jgi:autotransporter-associated beta strand protein
MPVSEAWADCATNGTTVNCTGPIIGPQRGFGTGVENGLDITVQQGALVVGDDLNSLTRSVFVGFELGDNNKINNQGQILGRDAGITAGNGLTLRNSGSIGDTDPTFSSTGIFAGHNVAITNNVGASIGGVNAEDGTVNNQGTMGPVVFDSVVKSTILNDGVIAADTARSPVAISFGQGSRSNRLALGTNSQITGQVLGAESDILELGGSGLRTFDVSSIGTQYLGFSTFNKTGGSTWTLTGSGNQNWNIGQGALVGDTNSLQGSQITNNAFLVFNQNQFDGTYRGSISGSGLLTKDGNNSLILAGDSSNFTGPTNVIGGRLQVDGSISSSSVFVNANTVLMGIGTVGATTVNSGGVLSPGHNGIGTLIVNGDLSFQSGTLYAITVSSGAALTKANVGLTQVNGTASLAGTALVNFQGSRFQSQYTILSAEKVSGQFDLSTVGLSSAITASLTYGTNAVTLNLKSDFAGGGTGTPGTGTPGTPGTGTPGTGTPGTPGTGTPPGNGSAGNSGPSNLTRNQHAVATALDNGFNNGGSLPPGLVALSSSQLPAAFDALSGEGTSATQETAFAAGQQFTSLMMQQGAFWRSGAVVHPNGVSYQVPMSYASEAERASTLPAAFKAVPAKPQNFEARWRGWSAGFDNASSLRGEADPGSADQSHRTAGGAAGLDYQLSPDLLLGMAAGGSSSSFSVADRLTSGSLEGAHVGGYGVARWNAWYAAGTLAFASFDNKTSRTIFGVGPTETAQGSFRSELLSSRFELGRAYTFNGFALTPFAAVEFARLWQHGYSETSTAFDGTPGINSLSYASHMASSLPTFLGVQFDSRLALASGMIWSPYARVSWVHEFEPTRDITASFIALPGSAFTVDGPRAAADAARVDLGSQFAITRNVALFGSFDGEFSDRSRMLTGKGGLKANW